MDNISSALFGFPLGAMIASAFTYPMPWYYYILLSAVSIFGIFLKMSTIKKEENERREDNLR